jgi:hypothetical protein
MYMLLKMQSLMGQRTGTYFIDSKKLPVCHNRRIHSNKVFSGFAARGKSSTGWYYGLKVYLIINQLGEIVNFEGLKGTCYGDKGYLSKLFDYFIKMG